MQIRPLTTAPFGAEVTEFDLAHDDLTPGQDPARQIRAALTAHQLLVLRDQGADLDPARLIALGRVFGVPHRVIGPAAHPDHPEIFVISNRDTGAGTPEGKVNDALEWHSDHSFHKIPSFASVLYGKAIPARNGGTCFISSLQAWRVLPESLKQAALVRSALHSRRRYHANFLPGQDWSPELAARYPDIIHPLVRRHPETGAPILFLSGIILDHVIGPDGRDEGRGLIAELLAHATAAGQVHTHAFRPGDIVIWDNRATMHKAEGPVDDLATAPDRVRSLWRVTIDGTDPVAPYSPPVQGSGDGAAPNAARPTICR